MSTTAPYISFKKQNKTNKTKTKTKAKAKTKTKTKTKSKNKTKQNKTKKKTHLGFKFHRFLIPDPAMNNKIARDNIAV